jgi:type I restriction enzyme, S subunit
MPQIRQLWPKRPLGEVADVVSGYAFKSSEFVKQGIPVIKIKNIRVGHVDLSEVQHVDQKYLSIPDRYHVQRGDVLISLTGSHISQPNSVVGRVARYSQRLPNCLLNQRAGKVIAKDNDNCDLGFLFYALIEQETTRAIAVKAHGAANQANVSPSQVESVEIPFPPLPVQQRIVGILSAYDDLIENNQRRIKILEEMVHSLYREWFVLFRFPGYNKVKMVSSSVGSIPQGWEINCLRNLVQFNSGFAFKSETFNADGQ